MKYDADEVKRTLLEWERATRTANALFQPGGEFHRECTPELWGKSTVADGIEWLAGKLREERSKRC